MEMRIPLIALATITGLISCKEDTVKRPLGEIPEEEVTSPQVATSNDEKIKFDFEATLTLINRINNGGSYEFFQSEWERLRSELQKAGAINSLPKEQGTELWWAIEYMRSCARPEILRAHNEEIIPILFSFDLPETNQQLKEILVDSGQLSTNAFKDLRLR